MTYKQWYQDYLRLYKRKLAEKTRESYTRLDTLISPIIGEKELEAITPDDIQAAIISAEETAGSRQAQLVYTLLHAAFRRAVRSGHIRQGFVLGGFGRTCANVGRDAGKEGTDAAQRKKRRANWLTLSNPFALTCR